MQLAFWQLFILCYCASIIGTILLSAAVCSDSSNTIQTEPVLVGNTLTRNFNGLKLSVKFLLVGDSCYWSHPGLTVPQTTIYNKFLLCHTMIDKGFHETCQHVLYEG